MAGSSMGLSANLLNSNTPMEKLQHPPKTKHYKNCQLIPKVGLNIGKNFKIRYTSQYMGHNMIT